MCKIQQRTRDTCLGLLGTVHGRGPLVSAGVDEVVFLTQTISFYRPPGAVLVLKECKIQLMQNNGLLPN